MSSAEITALDFDRAFYLPGQPLRLTVQLTSSVSAPLPARLVARVTHAAETAAALDPVEFILQGGSQPVELAWQPPLDSPRGYGLDIVLETAAGKVLAQSSAGFDVLAKWTQTPRYGFLSDFQPGRTQADLDETAQILARFHINGLQFYDWMYRHDHFLPPTDTFIDPLDRTLSLSTTKKLIAAVHARGMAAMPYTAIYAASMDFYRQHPDWALFDAFGKPVALGENFLMYMDPRPARPWAPYILDEFDEILAQTAFDGIHLDQYGDPHTGYDAQGQAFDMAQPLVDLIDAAKAHVTAKRGPAGAVVFNCVTNWPIEAVAPSDVDFAYIEVWPPLLWFTDLHQIVVGAQAAGKGKPVVIAAYVDPRAEPNVLLSDAVIFASGGSRIELGEHAGLLDDPYFPKYGPLSPDLREKLLRYYDFLVRYQDLIGPRTQDAAREAASHVKIAGLSTNPAAGKDIVYPLARQGQGFTSLSLVNLLGLPKPDWKDPIPAPPTPLGPTSVQLAGQARRAARVWFATPDQADLAFSPLPFSQAGDSLTFEIPGLAYWDLIYIEWE